MRSKPKSIRSKIIMALVAPVVALSVLWGLNVQTSVSDALALRSAYSMRDQVENPCLVTLLALQAERSRSQEVLAAKPPNVATLQATRAATDAAAADFRRLSSHYQADGEAAGITRTRITGMITNLDALRRTRTQIDAGNITRAAALSTYNDLIGRAFGVLSASASFGDAIVERVMHTVLAIHQVGELFSQEDALLTGAATAGRFGNGEYLQFVETAGALRFQIPTASTGLPDRPQDAYFNMLNNPAFSALRATENQILRDGRPGGLVPVTLETWRATFAPVAKQINDFVAQGYDKAIEYARAAGDRVMKRFILWGGLGLFAILLSLFLSIRIGSSVVNRLSMLRTAANDLARRGLPEVVARLRAGEQVTVDRDAPPLPTGNDEIADVGSALGEVQSSAIDSAVGEAGLRRGMSKVLVNVARRNQTLIDRQLVALAQIRPSNTSDESHPAILSEQLAQRLRRHAEHLVILAGSPRSGGGSRPVPLAELIGAAAGKVEAADRIEIRSIVETQVSGRASADIVHLLTELMENATTFSPPGTPVRVSAERVSHGIAVEIEDRGLGMTRSVIEETNRTMARPPDFDPANSARLGLVVVAQLAAQRGIRVVLQPSNFGGITAVVVLPPELVDAAVAGPAPRSAGQQLSAAHRLNPARLIGVPAGPEPVSVVNHTRRDRSAQRNGPPSATSLNRGVGNDGDFSTTVGASGQLPRRKRGRGVEPPHR